MTRTSARAFKSALACAAVAALAACGGGGDGSKASTGTLKLSVTDAPVDVADQVWIEFAGVELKPRSGPAFSIDFKNTDGTPAPKEIDLLEWQDARSTPLLEGATIPAGEYEWMRLKVNADPNVCDDSELVLESGQACEMRIPSGDETGLKLVRGFTVGVGSTTALTIDFDLRKSIVQPPGQRSDSTTCDGQVYLLKPALRIVDNLEVGTISGTVGQLPAGCDVTNPTYPGNVYLFGPYETDPPLVDDVDGIPDDTGGADPIATAKVSRDTFAYTIGFVPAGKYVIAYTCSADNSIVDADTDQSSTPPPTVDEVVTFSPDPGKPIVVNANQATTVDFPVPTP